MIDRRLHWYDLFLLSIFFLGLVTVGQTNGLVFPLLVQDDIGPAEQASYLGTLRLGMLMVALLTQAIWGLLSDHTNSRWGRRKPYILFSGLTGLVLLLAIIPAANINGTAGFWVLFAIVLALATVLNAGQAGVQSLIPDQVPQERRGVFSSTKAILELPLPLLLVALTTARLVASGMIPAALVLAGGILILTMALNLLSPDPPVRAESRLDWNPFLRLAIMAGVFTLLIIAAGFLVRLAGWIAGQIDALGWQVALLGITGLGVMLAVTILGVRSSIRISLGKQAARRQRSFTWWLINRMAFMIGFVNLAVFAIYYLQTRLGFSGDSAAKPVALGMAVIGAFILISAPLSGWLADRVGRKPLLVASGCLATAGVAIGVLQPQLVYLAVGALLIGLGGGIFYTASWALGTDLVPQNEAGRYLGIANVATAGAGALGAFAGGPLADYFTVHAAGIPGLGYTILFVLYGGMFFFSVLALSQVKTGPE